ncbi:FecR family protein [Caulobacter hibisci]|uniref:FecR family protein n=1 Tax=Caulobacter hibisci TaxID=2035993 RepID=A0ABS0T0F6_9CAUL|nr:FecR family protein [Caulobacter hibisci]MBI1685169.1 FecR family protein [Caulobacter hibisci]
MSLSTAPSTQAHEEAADWFARLKKKHVAATDLEAFRLWRKVPGNREAYDEVDRFWGRAGALQHDADVAGLLSDTLARTAPKPPRPKGWQFKPAMAVLLSVGGAALLVGGGYLALGPRGYATEVGEQRTLKLADGSTLTLDTASKVTVRFSGSRRDIRLVRGQALFDVAHDAARPFIVSAGDTSVTALGTRFDVRREEGGAKVTLLRGAVEVREQEAGVERKWRLAPGEGLSTAARAPKPAIVDVGAASSWASRRLTFKGTPLRDAVAEVGRYDRTRIELDVGALADSRISGVFDAGDTETFVSSVAEFHDLTVTHPAKGVIRLSRKHGADAGA